MATFKQALDAVDFNVDMFQELGAHGISVEEEGKNRFVIVLWFDTTPTEDIPEEVPNPQGVMVRVDTRREERFKPE
jgi:hypothetical protein